MIRPRWLRLEMLPAVIAIAMLSYRFCNLDLTTFINDEPHLLAAAEIEAHGGGWVSASPIAGTQHLHYGPVPTWFYGVVHVLFGSSPLVSIVAMGLLVTLGQVIFLAMLTRFLRAGLSTFAVLAALAASSPFAFAWSRTAWDNTILIGTFSCAALLLAADDLGARRCLVIGTLLGLAVGTHLMVLPVLILMLAVTFFTRRKDPKKILRRLALIAAPLLVVNLPYLFYLAHPPAAVASASVAQAVTTPHVAPPFHLGDALATIALTFLAPARVFTAAGVSYFFDDAWPDLRAWISPWPASSMGSWIAFILAGSAIAGLVLTLRDATPSPTKRLALLALCSWLGYAIFLLVDGLDPHPHYQHPIWWTIPTGLAFLVTWLRARSPSHARWLVSAVWLVALVQFSFLPMWMHYVRARGGTRGIHFTTPLAEERTWMREACATEKNFAIENHTVLFPASLDYLASTERACADHHVDICDGSCSAEKTVISLRYADAIGGHLAPP